MSNRSLHCCQTLLLAFCLMDASRGLDPPIRLGEGTPPALQNKYARQLIGCRSGDRPIWQLEQAAPVPRVALGGRNQSDYPGLCAQPSKQARPPDAAFRPS